MNKPVCVQCGKEPYWYLFRNTGLCERCHAARNQEKARALDERLENERLDWRKSKEVHCESPYDSRFGLQDLRELMAPTVWPDPEPGNIFDSYGDRS